MNAPGSESYTCKFVRALPGHILPTHTTIRKLTLQLATMHEKLDLKLTHNSKSRYAFLQHVSSAGIQTCCFSFYAFDKKFGSDDRIARVIGIRKLGNEGHSPICATAVCVLLEKIVTLMDTTGYLPSTSIASTFTSPQSLLIDFTEAWSGQPISTFDNHSALVTTTVKLHTLVLVLGRMARIRSRSHHSQRVPRVRYADGRRRGPVL